MERKTKIVATLGPAVSTPDAVRGLIRSGLDVARLNFSHGDHETHRSHAQLVKEAAEAEGRVVAVLQDIQGPKLRVGRFPDGVTVLATGGTVRVESGQHRTEPGTIAIGYEHLIDDIEPGESIILADGLIRLEVTDSRSDHLIATVVQGGRLADGKGVAFPDTNLRVPAITDKDRVDLAFGREIGVDFVAASFVRTGHDLEQIKELCPGTPVIAKIELAMAYSNLDQIIAESDGIMVARGDLGVEMPLERLPLVQADILARANAAGLITITATEMLESMTHSPRPTRAEVTDVANAVIAGTDAVMLSGETAVGEYPEKTVQTMAKICAEAEGGLPRELDAAIEFIHSGAPFASAVARAAVEAASNLGIDTIVAFTESGSTARLLSKYRPSARIIAFTPSQETLRRMALYRGVAPRRFGRRDYTDLMIAAAEKALEKEGVCQRGEPVVMVAGIPPNQQASTNLMKIHVVGERERGALSKRSARESPEVGGFG